MIYQFFTKEIIQVHIVLEVKGPIKLTFILMKNYRPLEKFKSKNEGWTTVCIYKFENRFEYQRAVFRKDVKTNLKKFCPVLKL